MKNPKIIITIFLVFLFLNFSAHCSAKDLVIFGNELKPPKYYLEDGVAKGVLIDIMKLVDADLPSTFKFELYPWNRAYSYAMQGKGGIIGISKNNERLKKFDYSDVLYYDTLILVVLKGNEFSYEKISDLKGKLIGVGRGSSYGEAFEQSKKILTYDEDGSAEQRLFKLLNKRIDVALIGPGAMGLLNIIDRNEALSKIKDKFSILSTPFAKDPNYLAFAKKLNMKGFLKEFNKTLANKKKSGEIQKIIDRYSEIKKVSQTNHSS